MCIKPKSVSQIFEIILQTEDFNTFVHHFSVLHFHLYIVSFYINKINNKSFSSKNKNTPAGESETHICR